MLIIVDILTFFILPLEKTSCDFSEKTQTGTIKDEMLMSTIVVKQVIKTNIKISSFLQTT